METRRQQSALSCQKKTSVEIKTKTVQIGRQRGPIEPRARQSTAPGVGLDQNISVCSNLLVVDGVDGGWMGWRGAQWVSAFVLGNPSLLDASYRSSHWLRVIIFPTSRHIILIICHPPPTPPNPLLFKVTDSPGRAATPSYPEDWRRRKVSRPRSPTTSYPIAVPPVNTKSIRSPTSTHPSHSSWTFGKRGAEGGGEEILPPPFRFVKERM